VSWKSEWRHRGIGYKKLNDPERFVDMCTNWKDTLAFLQLVGIPPLILEGGDGEAVAAIVSEMEFLTVRRAYVNASEREFKVPKKYLRPQLKDNRVKDVKTTKTPKDKKRSTRRSSSSKVR
jgi:hypothetical protein